MTNLAIWGCSEITSMIMVVNGTYTSRDGSEVIEESQDSSVFGTTI